MKKRIYLQIGKSSAGYKVSATNKPKHDALSSGSGYWKTVYPTVQIPIEVEIPDEMFELAKQKVVAHIKATNENSNIIIEVPGLGKIIEPKP